MQRINITFRVSHDGPKAKPFLKLFKADNLRSWSKNANILEKEIVGDEYADIVVQFENEFVANI